MAAQSPRIENARRTATTIAELCERHGLMRIDAEGIMRMPFLIKGSLRVPAAVRRSAIEASFAELDARRGPSSPLPTHARIADAQVLREPVYDRQTLQRTGGYHYTVMPTFDAAEVIELDTDGLAEGLYRTPFESILDYVDALRAAIEASASFVDEIRRDTLPTSSHPDFWHEMGFAAIPALLARDGIAASVDEDLAAWGIRGRALLDAWQPLPRARVQGTPVQFLRASLCDVEPEEESPVLRAMPTRQLHITAGNSPQIPFLSALRAISTKSAAVVKSPYGATLPGALLALAAVVGAPEHPITSNLSIVYWPGGDASIEDRFFGPGAFDRIVVWGAPGAVESVKRRAVFSKVLTFNPRYGVTLIGRETFDEPDLETTSMLAISDCLVANQKACIATQVIYVEGDDHQVARLAESLRAALARFDEAAPNLLEPHHRGAIKRLEKGLFLDGDWYVNERDGRFCSGVVVAHEEFPVAVLPMCRLVVLRSVARLDDVTRYLHHGVATASVHPTHRRLQLRDRLAARGVSCVVPLGSSGSGFFGQSHDGMLVLSELVDWKTG